MSETKAVRGVAGADMDTAVHVHVMEVVWPAAHCRICGRPLSTEPGGCRKGDCSMRPRPSLRADEPLPYSTDIAAAWRVVERQRAEFRRVEVHALGATRGGGAICMIENGNDEYEEHYVAVEEADTAPLAICIAALRVRGIEVTE